MVKSGSRGIRIAELARLSGTPKQTIHYYLRIGLLRKPRKTSKNMAYYDEGHVEQLKLIKRLRTDSYLPIEVIRRVLQEDRLRASVRRADLAGELFGLAAKSELEPLSRSELVQRSGLSAERLETYERGGLIRCQGSGKSARYRWEDARIAEILAQAETESGDDVDGLVLERFAIFERHVAELVRDEAAHFFGRVLAGGDPLRALELLRGGRETIARYLAVARVRRLREELEELFLEVEGAMRSPGPPPVRLSERTRHLRGEPEELERLQSDLRTNRERLGPHHALMEHLVWNGRPAEAVRLQETMPEKLRAHPRITLLAAEALLDCERYEDCLGKLDPLTEGDAPEDGGLEVLRGAAALGTLQRQLLTGSAEGAPFMPSAELIERLSAGLTGLLKARSMKASSPLAGLRAQLLVARVELGTPTFFGLRGDAVRGLRAVVEQCASLRGSSADPGFGALELVELNACRLLASVVRSEVERRSMEERAREIDTDPEPIPFSESRALEATRG